MCSRTVAVDHLDATPSSRSCAPSLAAFSGSPAPLRVNRSPSRSTQEDHHLVHQVVFCPQAHVHKQVKRETLKVIVPQVNIDGTGVPRCHSPRRRCNAAPEHRGSLLHVPKALCSKCFQFSTSVILSCDLQGRPHPQRCHLTRDLTLSCLLDVPASLSSIFVATCQSRRAPELDARRNVHVFPASRH